MGDYILFHALLDYSLEWIHYSVVDLLLMEQPTQSALQYPIILVFPLSSYNNPCSGVFLRYLRMRITFHRSLWRFYMNWLITLNIRNIKSCNIERNMSVPTNLLYLSGYEKVLPWFTINFWFGSMGLLIGLQFVNPVSSRMSRVYFLCEITPLFKPLRYSESISENEDL